MRYSDACLECIRSQARRLIELCSADPKERNRLFGLAMEIIVSPESYEICPPEVARRLYEMIARETGIDDPYRAAKFNSNREMLELYPLLKLKAEESDRPLRTAFILSILANSIDYAIADHSFDENRFIEELEHTELAIDDTELFIRSLDMADSLLYIMDNAGEAVADRLVLETIREMYPELQIAAAVRGDPVLNDVVADDVMTIGLDTSVDIIDNGYRLPGIPGKGSPEFEKAFRNSDLILAKGQGNFETERDDRRVFHLFRVKCRVISDYLKVPIGGAVFYEKL